MVKLQLPRERFGRWVAAAVACSILVPDSGRTDTPCEIKPPAIIARLQHPEAATSVLFLGEKGLVVVSGCADETLRAWNIATGKEIWIKPFDATPHSLARKDANSVFLSTVGSVEAWDITAGKLLWRLESEGDPGFRPSFDDIAVAPDKKSIAVARSNANIVFLDAQDGKVIRTIKHRNFDGGDAVGISCCSFSPDGKRLLGVSEEGVDIWDVKEGVIVRGFGHPHFKVSCAAFSPNEKQVVVGCQDKTIRVWEFGVGPGEHKFTGHTEVPLIIRFLDKDNVLTTGLDGLIIHWNIPQKKIIWKVKCTEKQVIDLAVSEDRKRIAAACETGDVVIYDLTPTPSR